MGYTTEFNGQFDLTPKLTPAQTEYLQEFSRTRRVKRNDSIAEEMPDPKREAVALPIGYQAEYFIGIIDDAAQDFNRSIITENDDPSIVDEDCPPSSQPSLYCHWIPNDEGTCIKWNGGEKFYYYEEWLAYIIEHFLEPWGVVANGTIEYQGEESCDNGLITVTNNKIGNGR